VAAAFGESDDLIFIPQRLINPPAEISPINLSKQKLVALNTLNRAPCKKRRSNDECLTCFMLLPGVGEFANNG
jgi:hypothetical protein